MPRLLCRICETMVGMDKMGEHSKRCMREVVLFNSEQTLMKLEASLEHELEKATQQASQASPAIPACMDAAPAEAALSTAEDIDASCTPAAPSVQAASATAVTARGSSCHDVGAESRHASEALSLLQRLIEVTHQVSTGPLQASKRLGQCIDRWRGWWRGQFARSILVADAIVGVLWLPCCALLLAATDQTSRLASSTCRKRISIPT